MIRLSISRMARLLAPLLFVPVAAHAAFDEQSRVSLDSVRLAPIPEIDPNARAVVIDDRPVVFGAEFTWIYDQAG